MTGKRITGTMRGLGALEVSEQIKGAFVADEGLLLADVGKLEKQRVVVYMLDEDPATATAQPDPIVEAEADVDALKRATKQAEDRLAQLKEGVTFGDYELPEDERGL